MVNIAWKGERPNYFCVHVFLRNFVPTSKVAIVLAEPTKQIVVDFFTSNRDMTGTKHGDIKFTLPEMNMQPANCLLRRRIILETLWCPVRQFSRCTLPKTNRSEPENAWFCKKKNIYKPPVLVFHFNFEAIASHSSPEEASHFCHAQIKQAQDSIIRKFRTECHLYLQSV